MQSRTDSSARLSRRHDIFHRGLGTLICEVASSSYVGVFGTGDPSDFPGRDSGNGSFFRNRAVGLRDYLDGTSHTIAVGERSQNLSRASWTGAVTGASVPITALQSEGGLDPEGGDALVVAHTGEIDGPNAIPAHADQFWALHPGGAMFLFADGSVRMIKARRPLPLFQTLGHPRRRRGRLRRCPLRAHDAEVRESRLLLVPRCLAERSATIPTSQPTSSSVPPVELNQY